MSEAVRTKQQEIDIKNLRFYADMAKSYEWQTLQITSPVIETTLREIADRLESALSAQPILSQDRTAYRDELANQIVLKWLKRPLDGDHQNDIIELKTWIQAGLDRYLERTFESSHAPCNDQCHTEGFSEGYEKAVDDLMSAHAPEGGDDTAIAQEICGRLFQLSGKGFNNKSTVEIVANIIGKHRTKLPAPEGMGRDAALEIGSLLKLELPANGLPVSPLILEIAEIIRKHALAHPTSESGTEGNHNAK